MKSVANTMMGPFLFTRPHQTLMVTSFIHLIFICITKMLTLFPIPFFCFSNFEQKSKKTRPSGHDKFSHLKASTRCRICYCHLAIITEVFSNVIQELHPKATNRQIEAIQTQDKDKLAKKYVGLKKKNGQETS